MTTEPLIKPTECCKDWEVNMPKVNAPIITQWARTGVQYDGKPFDFCPWCGSRLPQDAKHG